MTKGEKIEKIKEYFPEVEKIKDLKFKNAVIDIWVRVWEESTWDDLNECPFNPAFPDISLISHVNTVLELVMSSAFILEKNYPELKFDQDLLITGVLLHDVSKVVEIKKGDDGKRQEGNRGSKHFYYTVYI